MVPKPENHHHHPHDHHRFALRHATFFIVVTELLILLSRLDLVVDGFTIGTTTTIPTSRNFGPTATHQRHHHHEVLLNNANDPTFCLQDEIILEKQQQQQSFFHSSASSPTTSILIHWKGEGTEGSTLQFRHVEFQGSLQAVLLASANSNIIISCDTYGASSPAAHNVNDYAISFSNALQYSGKAEMPTHKRIRFNSAMQYLHLEQKTTTTTTAATRSIVPLELLIHAAERCSLIHAMYQVVASAAVTSSPSSSQDEASSSSSYERLSERALQGGLLDSMRRGNVEEHSTWCVRVRYYGGDDDDQHFVSSSNSDYEDGCSRLEKRRKREKRHGERTRSLSRERRALQDLKPLLLTFGGGVDLQNPDCKLYVMDGLLEQQRRQPSLLLNERDDDRKSDEQKQQRQQVKILARRIAIGPRVSIMAPATRICITNTPLCPMAAFWMCNIAGIRPGQAILDPFAGSCSILMAAAMIHGSCRTVGIEIAHNGLVNRADIRRDFVTRNLTLPCDLVHGDCTDVRVRRRAKRALLLPTPHDDDHHDKQHQHSDDDDDDHDDNDVSTLPSFDYIITDPPYGIRESTNYNSKTPMQELFQAIANDRHDQRHGETPLLKPGGKLVCFVPVNTGEDLFSVLPSQAEQDRAGLVLQKDIMQEQPLNENLSRWLLCFHSV
jgi:16S rRNA G966 N2-methylase RsmD